MAKRRRHMPKGAGWKLSYRNRGVAATLIKRIRGSEGKSIVIFKARTPTKKS